ncbi:MAG: hypothetical protein U1D31_01990 [Patescibacteria group bacterium]|nr:hypothetical protein [Patescibacteria group bacterium]
MQKNERGFVVQVLIALIAVFVSSGIYLFIYSQNREERVQAKLENAREKAAAETQRLDDLKKEFGDAHPLYAAVQNGYVGITNILRNADTFFDTSDSENPKIRIETKTSAIEADINAKRAQIENMLAEWKKQASLALATETNAATINSIQASATVIQSFINELAAIVGALTPSNSDLTQSEIDGYIELLSDAAEEIDVIVASLEAAESSVADASEETTTTTVTTEQIETQEDVVTQAQEEVAALEEELEEIQSQTETPATEEQPQDTSSQDDTTSDGGVDYTGESSSPDPIIVVPGPPRLIQGANKN